MRAWRGYISFCKFARRRSVRDGGVGRMRIQGHWNGMEWKGSGSEQHHWHRLELGEIVSLDLSRSAVSIWLSRKTLLHMNDRPAPAVSFPCRTCR